MSRPSPLSLAFALAAASAGLDVALAAGPSRGWHASDVVVLWVLGAATATLFLSPVAMLPRAPGLLVGTAALIQLAPALRFGPLVNVPLRSPLVLGTLLLVTLATLVPGALLSDRMPRRSLAIGLLGPLGLTIALLRASPDHEPAAMGPNIVLITIDTLRADRLTPELAPNLTAIGAAGARFDTAIAAAPQTGPSHLSLLTGRFPLTTGVVANGTPIGDQPTLARALQRAGYTTAAFVGAFPVHARYGFDQGFDVYDSDFSPVPGLHDLSPVRLLDLAVFRNLPRERRGDAVNERAIAWLKKAEGPYFLWVHYYDPHGPYTPPAPFGAEGEPREGDPIELPAFWPADQRAIHDPDWHTARYDAEVAWTDSLVGELLTAIGPLDHTVVIATSDHGESLGEHGILFDHGDDLYDPALRVPLVVRGPNVQPGVVVTAQTPTVDLVPTLLDLIGLPDPHDRDGVSLVPQLAGEPGVDGDAYASTVAARHADPPVHHALRRPSGKCIRRTDGPHLAFVDAPELVDVGAAALPEVCTALDARVDAASPAAGAASDAATLEALRELGYVEPE